MSGHVCQRLSDRDTGVALCLARGGTGQRELRKSVQHAGVFEVADRNTRLLQSVAQSPAVIPQRIYPGGIEEGRRQTFQVRQQRRHQWIAPLLRRTRIRGIEKLHVGKRTTELGGAEQTIGFGVAVDSIDAVKEHQLGRQWQGFIAQPQCHGQHNVGACRCPAQRQCPCRPAKFLRVLAQPFEGRHRIFDGGGERGCPGAKR